jgi:prolyl oligopeptidase
MNPTLIRIDVKAGHGAGKSVAATIQENVDIQAFTLLTWDSRNYQNQIRIFYW